MKDTAAGGVVYAVRDGALLFLFIDDRFGRLSLPKGHLEPGETEEAAALREIEEETGIQGRIVEPLGEVAYAFQDNAGERVDKTVRYFLVEATGGALKAQREEVQSALWLPLQDVLSLHDARGYANNRAMIVEAMRRLKRRLAQTIDHTLLRAEATKDEIVRLCDEAMAYGFASVCVQPGWVPLVASRLKGSGVKTCAVVGFPLGGTLPEVKAYEAYQAVQSGAEEIDMVINIGALKSGDEEAVRRDLEAVVEAAKPKAIIKAILETASLTDEEKRRAAEWAVESGVDFVKTSTGFGAGGATADDVRLLKAIVGKRAEIKASGGIRDLKTALAMLEAGATRLGTSSGVKIIREFPLSDAEDLAGEAAETTKATGNGAAAAETVVPSDARPPSDDGNVECIF